jgi:hypothetical protein
MMKKLGQIIGGWSNLILDKVVGVDPLIRKMANERLQICEACPLRTGNRCDPNKSGNHVETHASTPGCGCILSAKALAPTAECPLGKW